MTLVRRKLSRFFSLSCMHRAMVFGNVTKRLGKAFTEFRNKTEISDLQSARYWSKSEVLRQGLNCPRMAPSLLKSDRSRNVGKQGCLMKAQGGRDGTPDLPTKSE